VRSIGRVLRNRLLPAFLTAPGVSLIAGGLLTYTGASEATLPPPESPIVIGGDPSPSPAPSTAPGGSPSAPASSAPTPSAAVDRVATRVVIRALKIDLPVIKPRGGSNAYPQCNVAMYIQELHQPGEGRATYLYAHARDGMFGPIYERAILGRHGGPKSMRKMLVEVYTSDDQVFWYEISQVRLHQLDLGDAVSATSEQLWLQTSEGPKGTPGKTQILALPIGVLPADHKDAHPKARPVNCG
jgi:hypothetical protein